MAEFDALIRKLMENNSITEFEIQDKRKFGNCFEELIFLKIVPKTGYNPLDIVIKTAKKATEFRNKHPVENAYEREAYMYSQVFPEFTKFLETVNSNVKLDYIPKVYWVSHEPEHETLIMDNLLLNGFQTLNGSNVMNMDHVLCVAKNIGKHHAISMAFQQQKPEIFNGFVENLSKIWCDYGLPKKGYFFEPFKNTMKLLARKGRADLIPRFKHIQDNLDAIVNCPRSEDERLVICHGNFWNNNIFFKYQENQTLNPSAVCFTNYQMSVVDTPVKDLSFFLYSACDKTVLDHFELILQTYHASLSTTLTFLGSNPDDLFPYEQLKDHWKKYGAGGLVASTQTIRLALTNTGDIFSAATAADQLALSKAFGSQMKQQEEYDRRVMDIFTHFVEYFL